MGSLSLLQRIFLTQELNRGLLHCRWILYQLSYQGVPMDKSMSKLEDTVKTRGAWHAAVHGVAKSRTRLSGSRTKQPPDTLSFFLKDFFPFLCHPPSCFPSCFYSNSFLKDGLSLGPRFILFCSHTTSLGNPIHSSVQPRSFS